MESFTQICVLQSKKNKKRTKSGKKKVADWAKVGKAECHDNSHQCYNKAHGI